jgi:hypothetical protein
VDKFSTDNFACAKVNEQNSCELLSLKANRDGVSRQIFLEGGARPPVDLKIEQNIRGIFLSKNLEKT